MLPKSSTRIIWLDSLRGLAIAAVVVNHLFGIIYSSVLIRNITSFAVPLFILLAGYTSTISLERNRSSSKFIKKRFKSILIPYFLVTIFYQLGWGQYPLSIKLLLVNLATFSASPVLYFVFFYLQLILIAPFLFELFEKSTHLRRFFYLLLALIVGFLINSFFDLNKLILPSDNSINSAFIRDHGYILGANKLFGGSYLFLFALGINLGIYKTIEKIPNKWLFGVLGLIISSLFFATYKNSLWANPPNLLVIFYTILIFATGVPILKSVLRTPTHALAVIGEASLYIFLLHPAFIGFVGHFDLNINIFTAIIYFVACIAGPLLIFKLLNPLSSKSRV